MDTRGDGVSLTPEQQEELREFIVGFPADKRDLIVDWPPGCIVKTRPGVILLIPAPGVEGTVISYFESGLLGVAAPMTLPHPDHGWGDGAPGKMVKAQIDPTDLEFIREETVSAADVREAMS
jgi:hypothetical protein